MAISFLHFSGSVCILRGSFSGVCLDLAIERAFGPALIPSSSTANFPNVGPAVLNSVIAPP